MSTESDYANKRNVSQGERERRFDQGARLPHDVRRKEDVPTEVRGAWRTESGLCPGKVVLMEEGPGGERGDRHAC